MLRHKVTSSGLPYLQRQISDCPKLRFIRTPGDDIALAALVRRRAHTILLLFDLPATFVVTLLGYGWGGHAENKTTNRRVCTSDATIIYTPNPLYLRCEFSHIGCIQPSCLKIPSWVSPTHGIGIL